MRERPALGAGGGTGLRFRAHSRPLQPAQGDGSQPTGTASRCHRQPPAQARRGDCGGRRKGRRRFWREWRGSRHESLLPASGERQLRGLHGGSTGWVGGAWGATGEFHCAAAGHPHGGPQPLCPASLPQPKLREVFQHVFDCTTTSGNNQASPVWVIWARVAARHAQES